MVWRNGNAQPFYFYIDDTKAISHWKLHSQKTHIDKNTISNPADFRHLEHIGYTTGKGFTIEGNTEEQNAMIDQLKALGITPEEINQNQEFIHQFLNQHNTGNHAAAKITANSAPPQPNSVLSPVPSGMYDKQTHTYVDVSLIISFFSIGRRPPPPPPPPRKKTTASPSRPPASPRPTPAPTSFPLIPQRGSRQSPAAIQSNVQDTMSPPPPPPPPPPPMMAQASTRSSPLPPTIFPPAPPPPPSSSSNSDLPPVPDGRSNLMSSIRATGGIGSLRKGTHTRHTSSTATATAGIGGTAAVASMQDNNDGGGLASSLAAVLKQRQTAMQSDDEDDDDDWE
ncbi:unnamed protein product [Absidia cylindrospora]